MAHSIDKIVELVIIGALLCIVPLVTLVMACIKTAEESYFKQHAIIAMGKNVSYNLNHYFLCRKIHIIKCKKQD